MYAGNYAEAGFVGVFSSEATALEFAKTHPKEFEFSYDEPPYIVAYEVDPVRKDSYSWEVKNGQV
jgi:hypothetical protein